MGKNVPIGSYSPDHTKQCVNGWWINFAETLGTWSPCSPDGLGHEILSSMESSNVTVVTGSPPKNLAAYIHKQQSRIERWVGQGGYAGECVPEERKLPKFRGVQVCPSFNFNGAPLGVLELLASPKIGVRQLVSKDVCHGLLYDSRMHERVSPFKNKSGGLSVLYAGMAHYLSRNPQGKLFHDPLAVCAAINPDIIEWCEAEVYRTHGSWGSRPKSGTRTYVSIGANHEAFFEEMVR